MTRLGGARIGRSSIFAADDVTKTVTSIMAIGQSVELFGPRAFLPLNQTGKRALSPDDVKQIHSGVAAVPLNDNDGCPVLLLQPDKFACDPRSGLQRFRVWFDFYSLAAENPKAQSDGICGGEASASTTWNLRFQIRCKKGSWSTGWATRCPKDSG